MPDQRRISVAPATPSGPLMQCMTRALDTPNSAAGRARAQRRHDQPRCLLAATAPEGLRGKACPPRGPDCGGEAALRNRPRPDAIAPGHPGASGLRLRRPYRERVPCVVQALNHRRGVPTARCGPAKILRRSRRIRRWRPAGAGQRIRPIARASATLRRRACSTWRQALAAHPGGGRKSPSVATSADRSLPRGPAPDAALFFWFQEAMR